MAYAEPTDSQSAARMTACGVARSLKGGASGATEGGLRVRRRELQIVRSGGGADAERCGGGRSEGASVAASRRKAVEGERVRRRGLRVLRSEAGSADVEPDVELWLGCGRGSGGCGGEGRLRFGWVAQSLVARSPVARSPVARRPRWHEAWRVAGGGGCLSPGCGSRRGGFGGGGGKAWAGPSAVGRAGGGGWWACLVVGSAAGGGCGCGAQKSRVSVKRRSLGERAAMA